MDRDDNLNQSYKWLRDWLCHSGFITGDGPNSGNTFLYEQEKVAHKKDGGTIVVVEYLAD
jgi:hypothetical protein